MDSQTIPNLYKVVRLDQTFLYNIDESDKKNIVSIENVFLYDYNTAHYLCSLEKNYLLIHLYTDVEFAPHVSEYERERLLDEYTSEGFDDVGIYIPSRQIDQIKTQRTLGELDDDQTEEELIEYLRGNWII